MSSSDRRNVLTLLLALPVAACGFTPVYRAGGAAAGLDGAFQIAFEDSRDGYLLHAALENRLGMARAPRFDLKTALAVEEQQILLTAATGVSRISAYGAVQVTVADIATGTVLLERTYREAVGYSATSETAQTEASRRKAYERLMEALADKIALDLAAAAESWPS